MNLNQNEVHILAIEDDPEMREFLCRELTGRGYRVQTAANGAEAVELVEHHQFNLVISDMRMPVMDGITALEILKSADPHLEVIMISGCADIEAAVSAMKQGAFDFLEKPVCMEKLLLLIEKALEKSEVKMLIALYEASRMLFSSVKFDELLTMVMNTLFSVFKADEGSFMLMGEDERLHIAYGRGLSDEVVRSTSIGLGERVAGFAGERRRPFLLIGGLENYDEFKGIPSRPGILSSIVIPVYCNDKFLGVLNLNRTTYRQNFSYKDLCNVTIFASQLGQTVYNSRLAQTLDAKLEELKCAQSTLEETKLEEKEKLTRVGGMIAGMAHEINNPLTAVMGYTELLLNQGDLKEDTRKKLNVVMKEAQLCRDLAQDLLRYSRRRKPSFEAVDLHELLEDTLSAAALHIRDGAVKVRYACPKDCPPVKGDAPQLRQVFFNLVKNACQALESAPARRHLVIKVKTDPKTATIMVADNGPGIPEDALKRIFEPFFTTKSEARGTGLGLSIVRDIVADHGGTIRAVNAPKGGAVFVVSLPLFSVPVSPRRPTPRPDLNPRKASA